MDKNLLHVATHLLATGRTAFSLFLAQYPDTILVLIALGLLAFWWQHHRLVVWRRCASENREGQVKAQEECGRRHLKIQALSKENALFIDQLSY